MHQQSIIQYFDPRNSPYSAGSKPNAASAPAVTSFRRESRSILENIGIRSSLPQYPLPDILNLSLAYDDVQKKQDESKTIKSNVFSRILFVVGRFFVDNFFDNRPIERFWFSESLSRIPHFSFISMLQVYESIGED